MSRVAIVSGGTRGIGASIVEHLLGLGYRVATFGRSESEAIQALRAASGGGDQLYFETVDAADAEQLKGFVEAVIERYGRVDALVNNAGLARDGVLALMTDQDIEVMLSVNVRGAIVLARECVRHMLVQREGVILNVTSIVGSRGYSGLSGYSATKAALVGFTRSLAREVGRQGIRVNALAPGFLHTEMSAGLSERQREQIQRRTPLGRLGTVEDLLPWVEFLLADGSRFMTGQVVTVDGGASV